MKQVVFIEEENYYKTPELELKSAMRRFKRGLMHMLVMHKRNTRWKRRSVYRLSQSSKSKEITKYSGGNHRIAMRTAWPERY